jgi:hypothetical protein
VFTGVTEITNITTKQDMSRWTRAHADVPGITWSVFAGPGGTMIIVEHDEDRCSRTQAGASADVAPAGLAVPAAPAGVTAAAGPAGRPGVHRVSA